MKSAALSTAIARSIPILLAITFCLNAGTANAQVDRYWSNTTGGEFSFPFNWDTGVPFTNDHGYFDIPDTYVVDISGDAEVGWLSMLDGNIFFEGGNELTVVNEFRVERAVTISGAQTNIEVLDVVKIESPSNLLQIQSNGALYSDWGLVGSESGSFGNVHVKDTARWQTGELKLGTADGINTGGLGLLSIDANAFVEVTRAGGTPDLPGFRVGDSGTGSQVDVMNSSTIVAFAPTYVAHIPDGSGLISISGLLSLLAANDVHVGYSNNSDGQIDVSDGAKLNGTGCLSLGAAPGSTGTVIVSGPNSTLTGFPLGVKVGVLGVGEILVQAGGQLNTDGDLEVGIFPDSSVVVSGIGSSLSCANAFIDSLGILRVDNATLNVDGQLEVDGEVECRNDAMITSVNDGPLSLIGIGFFNTRSSEVTTFDCEVTNLGLEIKTNTGGNTIFTESYIGECNFDGSGTVTFEGDFSPGDEVSIDALFAGNAAFGSAANTILQIAMDVQFDTLLVSGHFQAAGNLTIELTDGFTLSPGQTFLVVDVVGNQVGEFAGLPEDAICLTDNGIDLFIRYTGGDGNDIELYTSVAPVTPQATKFLDGSLVTGQLSDVFASDDVDAVIDPSPTTNPNKQIIEVIMLSESPTLTPDSFSFVLEAAMNGGPTGDVIQTIECFNYITKAWETVDSRAAADSDEQVVALPTGNLSRFVHPLNSEVLSKVTWKSPTFAGSQFAWSINLDQAVWKIE